MPIAGHIALEGPFHVCPRPAALHMRVERHIGRVVIINELVVDHLPIDSQGRPSQQKANQECAPGLVCAVHLPCHLAEPPAPPQPGTDPEHPPGRKSGFGRQAGVDQSKFPSPRPSPEGGGRIVSSQWMNPLALDFPKTVVGFSLSLRERAGVRGILGRGAAFQKLICAPPASSLPRAGYAKG